MSHRPLVSIGAALSLVMICAPAARSAPVARTATYAPDEIVVSYAPDTPAGARAKLARLVNGVELPALAPHTRVLRLTRTTTVARALARLRRQPDVRWAVPDYIAHAAGAGTATPFIPNNPGDTHTPGGWTQLQWNFVGQFGVNAPQAWGNLISEHANGGHGVIVAVLDTGIAYRNVGRYRRSPGFYPYQFVKGFDFVHPSAYPIDHNGHGTFVAGEIAEATNNGIGLTGLAYGARLMPVQVLDSQGEGEASTIAKGVMFAVKHGAQVINLSLEFSPGVNATDIPELIEALSFAHRRGVVVVAAAGNEGRAAIAYPAHAPDVIAVGASTEDGCLADYSNFGGGLTLVAPGGGADADLPNDPNCHPEGPAGRDIFQETFTESPPRSFGLPSGYEGTSMATPEVAATAALIIASGVLGHHPTPSAVLARLTATATPVGGPDSSLYGAGLLNAATATAPTGAGA
ncbi:MAG TPA: S8 family serine peptidase [Solirubrobacteraceae bacterium]|jgi:serine protease|nr:S8 family serine peptidase [Solirubrobacteraceae bacterium]